LTVVISYNVQVAGPNARAGTLERMQKPAQRQGSPAGTTNITIHCENGKVNVGSRRSGR
jgi:hypothetical protein